MYSRFERPKDTSAVACGRCLWWKQTTSEGWGRCCLSKEFMWYQHAVCSEYELDQ